MTDLFDDEDMFAPRPARKKPPQNITENIPARPVRRVAPVAEPAAQPVITANGSRCPPAGIPLSYACPCGARDEVKPPAPDRLDCWSCRGLETMARYQPAAHFIPPVGAGRELTSIERKGMKLDERR